jgi:putative SOS response-associated peptidase YedK
MCGRYTLTIPTDELREQFAIDVVADALADAPARYNIAPTQDVPCVRLDDAGRRELVPLRWGLIPFWAKDKAFGNRAINARSETIGEKPAFKHALEKRRCLVLADGFYEWRALSAKKKQPFRILRPDRKAFAFAGLFERATIDGVEYRTCTILTTEANETIRVLHDRMPVILDDAGIARWLDPATAIADATQLLVPAPADLLTMYAVDARVGSPAFEDAACIAPAVEELRLF